MRLTTADIFYGSTEEWKAVKGIWTATAFQIYKRGLKIKWRYFKKIFKQYSGAPILDCYSWVKMTPDQRNSRNTAVQEGELFLSCKLVPREKAVAFLWASGEAFHFPSVTESLVGDLHAPVLLYLLKSSLARRVFSGFESRFIPAHSFSITSSGWPRNGGTAWGTEGL